MNTFQINEVTYEVPWEEINCSGGSFKCEYIEIIDFDSSTNKHTEPVDLNDSYALAQNGLDPSESNLQFHQQMVYAVIMTTIKNFEHALGRKVQWATSQVDNDPENGQNFEERYVGRLKVYPHSMEKAHAYYDPHGKALHFGYFKSKPSPESDQMPDTLVYTCLSQDIIVHETTHAILDGMQKHYTRPTNYDVRAFHEALADLVALFQHFSFPEALKYQIKKTKGNLFGKSLLSEIAEEFGIAIGKNGSLRTASEIDDFEGYEQKNHKPYQRLKRPHSRGNILVSAIFEAFVNIYEKRIADLVCISINEGQLGMPMHPELVNRLAKEASKTAKHMLNICIRAIDYCPPVDITFGEYLRALITADIDMEDVDSHRYRLAFIESFKRRGIFPEGINSLSVDNLKYPEIQLNQNDSDLIKIVISFLKDFTMQIAFHTNREDIYEITKASISGELTPKVRKLMNLNKRSKLIGLHERIDIKFNGSESFIKLTGLVFNKHWKDYGIRTSAAYNGRGPDFQVNSLRLISKVGPEGNQINQVVFSIVQSCGAVMKDGRWIDSFTPLPGNRVPELDGQGFLFRGGCTLIFDLDKKNLKYAIVKPILIENNTEEKGPFQLNKDTIEKQWRQLNNSKLNSFCDNSCIHN